MKHQFFYKLIQADQHGLKKLIKLVAKFLVSLQNMKIVHGDLKPENILVEFNPGRTTVVDIRVKDFQSFCKFEEMHKLEANTPEYLPPEVLEYIDEKAKKPDLSSQSLLEKSKPWSIDVFSLGVTLLEIASGYPIWISKKCKSTNYAGRSMIGVGVFGVPNRNPKKIAKQQTIVIGKLKYNLKKCESYGLGKDVQFMDLLSQMLNLDPQKRISPQNIIEHEFCKFKLEP